MSNFQPGDVLELNGSSYVYRVYGITGQGDMLVIRPDGVREEYPQSMWRHFDLYCNNHTFQIGHRVRVWFDGREGVITAIEVAYCHVHVGTTILVVALRNLVYPDVFQADKTDAEPESYKKHWEFL